MKKNEVNCHSLAKNFNIKMSIKLLDILSAPKKYFLSKIGSHTFFLNGNCKFLICELFFSYPFEEMQILMYDP